MDESHERNAMMPQYYEFGSDNFGFNQTFQKPIVTKLIVVQPKLKNDETLTSTPSEICEVKISSNNDKVLSDQDSLSNGSIEELDISSPNKTEKRINYKTDFETKEENDSNFMNENNEHSKEVKDKAIKDIQEDKIKNPFKEKLTFAEMIMNPNSQININNFKKDLHRFLLTPPPKNVVVKCQVSKTNNIDKTLLFTNFIFSLQLFDTKDVNPIEALMIGYRNLKSKKNSFFISSHESAIHSNSSSIVGYIKTNFLGTRFMFYSKNNNEDSTEMPNDDTSSNQNLKDFNHMGVIFYKNSKFSSSKPRTINIAIPNWDDDKDCYDFTNELPKERTEALNLDKDGIISFENELPRYDESKKLYVLNFGGRVTEKSVKNFALNMKIDGKSKRVYQLGKCKNHYIVDFTYPLCAFQAFAIALSCCQRKIATD